MAENLMLALQITALGMGLVFGAIILLWLLMLGLTALPLGDDGAQQAQDSGTDAEALAAAVAVAATLAERGAAYANPLNLPPTALISAWQLGMRTRQMYEKGNRLG